MPTAPDETSVVEHEVRVGAHPRTVFAYFTDPAKLLRWIGVQATLDPRPGGVCRIAVSQGATMLGEFVEVEPPRRIVLTWGWEEEAFALPPQSTVVEIALTPEGEGEGEGTIVRLTHRRLPAAAVSFHSLGWERHLDRLAAAAGDGGNVPMLWHLKVSPYNEKARWALDYKWVAHVRRAAMPGRHRAIAKDLSGGSTFPVLVLDGEAIGDSTWIIAALERRHPEPPLYPADPTQRRRALALEDFFDEELGRHMRVLVLHHMLPDADLMLGAFAPDLGGARRLVARATFPRLRPRVCAEFGIDDRSVERAYAQVQAAGERFRSELQPSGYLVGERFTVADLTLAALLAPAVAPEQFPYPQPQREHPLLAPLREALAEHGLVDWTREMYARHRGRSAEIPVA